MNVPEVRSPCQAFCQPHQAPSTSLSEDWLCQPLSGQLNVQELQSQFLHHFYTKKLAKSMMIFKEFDFKKMNGNFENKKD